jgi:hypothetical protein
MISPESVSVIIFSFPQLEHFVKVVETAARIFEGLSYNSITILTPPYLI